MTRKRRRRSDKQTRESLREAQQAARQAAGLGDEPVELDPASELFLQFAAPLLLQARSDEEFQAAVGIAEFVWATAHFNAATQAQMMSDFIKETEIPDNMIPWFMDVYAELAERKDLLVG